MNNIHIRLTSIFLLTLGLALSQTALAQKIQVKAANPAWGVQGMTSLVVEIDGNGFDDTINEVIFLLPCPTEDPCEDDTGGIVVTDFEVLSRKKIKTIINLKLAELADFDIAVRSTTRGRGGKGTTLFKVQSKDTGGGTGSTLTAEFCLVMLPIEDENPGLESDGKTISYTPYDYCHDRKERVQIGTGSQPGFRFDSNTKSRPPLRSVKVNVLNGPVIIKDDFLNFLNFFDTGNYQIDLRFDRDNDGLDLGGILPGINYFVPVNIWLDSLDGVEHFGLAYGPFTNPLSSGLLNGNDCVFDNTLDALVKLIEIDFEDDHWSIESNPDNATACLWDLNADLENQSGTPVNMPFYFEIFIK